MHYGLALVVCVQYRLESVEIAGTTHYYMPAQVCVRTRCENNIEYGNVRAAAQIPIHYYKITVCIVFNWQPSPRNDSTCSKKTVIPSVGFYTCQKGG
jgi:hypothetical protein